MTITIHIWSLLFGIFLGAMLFAAVYCLICVRGDEFSQGWNCGKYYAEKKHEEEKNENSRC